MDFKYLESEICVPNKTLYCQELSTGALRELQAVLKSVGYYNGGVDGIYGINTLNAIAAFKKDSYLNRPTEIGKGTVEALKKLGDRAGAVKEEQVARQAPVINTQAGKQTGKSVMLPGNIRVHENEWIIPGVALTWGEMTKGLTRIPVSTEVVGNIIGVAKAFAQVRADINLPLRINSGYRPPELKIGASKSQHKLGNAIDVCPINGDLNRLWEVGVKSSAIGLGKGMHLGFVHLDWRPNSKRVVFSY
jgi:Peptidase M15/Putative peptidoglycan binding domain